RNDGGEYRAIDEETGHDYRSSVGCDLCCLLLLRLDLLPRPHSLQAFDDPLPTRLETVCDNPILAALGPQFDVTAHRHTVRSDHVYEFNTLISRDRLFRNKQSL